jgi:hypothetical protein
MLSAASCAIPATACLLRRPSRHSRLPAQPASRWTDNSLLIDWERVEAVGALRDRLETLYREGIDLGKVSYWIAPTTWAGTCIERKPAGRRHASTRRGGGVRGSTVLDDEFR